jgi:hypothetical protein
VRGKVPEFSVYYFQRFLGNCLFQPRFALKGILGPRLSRSYQKRRCIERYFCGGDPLYSDPDTVPYVQQCDLAGAQFTQVIKLGCSHFQI